MPKFRLPKGCMNVEMYDGTVYRGSGSRRSGRVVEVDDPVHARKLTEMGAVKGFTHEVFGGESHPERKPGRVCPACGFNAWAWQSNCPKCLTPTEKEE